MHTSLADCLTESRMLITRDFHVHGFLVQRAVRVDAPHDVVVKVRLAHDHNFCQVILVDLARVHRCGKRSTTEIPEVS
eukprot:4210851-Pyramimonas_sp.AAC.1